MHAIIRLRRYTKAIGNNEESQGFTYFFKGMIILLIGLMLTSLVPTLKGVLHTQGRSTQALTITTNYAYVIPYLLAFWCFFLGARKLSSRIREKNSTLTYIFYGALLTMFAYIWLDLIFTNSSRTVSTNPAIPATYYLRDSLIILTIVLPSFIAWILGFLGVLELRRYGTQVKGILYRSALRSFIKGVGGVIIGSVLLQGLLSLGTARLLQLGLDKLLIIIYMFLIIQGLGFFFIAQGSRRLTKIESV